MKKEKIEELFYKHSLSISLLDTVNKTAHPLVGTGYRTTNIELFTQAINQAELEWYKKLLDKLEFIYGSDLKVFGTIIDKNANNYYNEIQEKIKELENDR